MPPKWLPPSIAGPPGEADKETHLNLEVRIREGHNRAIQEKLHEVEEELKATRERHAEDTKTSIQGLQVKIEELEKLVQKAQGAEEELKESREQSAQDNRTIQALRVKVVELETLVERQKATISTQSKAISDPRNARRYVPAVGPVPQPGSAALMTPRWESPSERGDPFNNVFEPGPVQQRVTLPVNAGVARASALGEAYDNTPSPPAPPHWMAVRTTSPHAMMRPGDMHLGSNFPAADPDTAIRNFGVSVQDLWTRTHMFGHKHVSFPNIHMDSKLDPKIKSYLIAIADMHHVSSILGNPATRHCLFTKAVNFYLAREVLVPTVTRGFDANVDREMEHLQRQIMHNTPATKRHNLKQTLAHYVKNLLDQPLFHKFCQERARFHTQRIWELIWPLTRNPGSARSGSESDAWTELTGIVAQAQSLGLQMYSAPLEYRFDFPEHPETFDPTTMISRDTFIRGEPLKLQQAENRVRLGISPIVRVRNNSRQRGETQIVYLADVILRPPKKREGEY